MLFTCNGCQQMFCSRHVNEHQQDLALILDQITQDHDLIYEESCHLRENQSTLEQIDQWERHSVRIIRETAERIRSDFHQWHEETTRHITEECSSVAKQIRTAKDVEGYTEINLDQWKQRLMSLRALIGSMKNSPLVEENNVPIKWIRLKTNPDLDSRSKEDLKSSEPIIAREEQPRRSSTSNIYVRKPRPRPTNPRDPECKQQ